MRALLATVLLLVGCTHVASRPPPLSGWRELRSLHFRLRTNLPAADARTTIERLETLRAALQTAWSDAEDTPGSTEAIVLRERAELRTFTEWTGLATGTRRGLLLIAAGSTVSFGDASPRLPLLAHEVAHDLDRRRMPGVPRWFDEGMATYLESVELIDAGRVRLGKIGREDLGLARSRPLIPLDVLARTPWETATAPALLEIYRSSRIWIHLLRAEEPARFRTLQAALRRGVPWRTAWTALRQDLDLDHLEDTLRRWLYSGEFPTELHRFSSPAGPMEERSLPPWEVHLAFGELWLVAGSSLEAGERARRARGAIEEAAAAAPDEPLPQVRLADLETDPDVRRERAETLARRYPRSAEAAVHLARVLRDQGGPLEGRRAAMLEAVVLAPENVDALTAYAVEEARYREFARASEALRSAEALEPWNPTVFLCRSAILASLGDCSGALDAVQRALDVLPDEPPPADVLALLRERERIRAACPPGAGP